METKQNQELENIKEKIAKLLRKADSASELNSIAEATAFANKANELLMQYNLKVADINLKAGLPVEPEIIVKVFYESDLYKVKKTDSAGWIVKLLNVVSSNNLCKVVTMGGIQKDTRFRIFGTENNINSVISLTQLLCNVSNNLASKYWSEYHGDIKRNKFKRDFLNGFPSGLNTGYKIREVKANEFALVRTNEVAIKCKVEQVVGQTTSNKHRATNVNDAYFMGVKAGSDFEAHKNIS